MSEQQTTPEPSVAARLQRDLIRGAEHAFAAMTADEQLALVAFWIQEGMSSRAEQYCKTALRLHGVVDVVEVDGAVALVYSSIEDRLANMAGSEAGDA